MKTKLIAEFIKKCDMINFYVRNVYYYINEGSKKYFTYIGETDRTSQMYCGDIGLPDDSRVYIPINGLNNLVLFTDRLLLINKKEEVHEFRLNGVPFSLDAHEFSCMINAICSNILTKYSNNIINLSSQNYNSVSNMLNDIVFPESIIRLLEWNQTKKKLKFDKKSFIPHVARFNVYFAYYGTNIGSEINKLRPVVIWKQHENQNNISDNSYFVFPLSTKKGKRRLPYHVELEVNSVKNYIRINDGKRISIRRIEKPLIDSNTGMTFCLTQAKIDEMKEVIKKYFSL